MEGGGPRILVVDDVADTREMYADSLRFVGFDVAEAGNGAEALEQAIALRPDVIVMDFAMPLMDGGEAARRLANDKRTRDIPIVMISAFGDAVPAEVRGQVAAFLPKPCQPDELSQLLRLVIEARSAAR
jgi:CheY-like chemotaxis protein